MIRRTWRATYADTGEHAENVNGSRYTPAHTYREAQAEADRSGRAVVVANGHGSQTTFNPTETA